jgi:hypothetical protein
MKKGFKKVVPSLVQATPGLTDTEYAKIALDRGLCRSDSKDPIMSLATTMRKEIREGRMPGIKAVKVDGKLHFFPEKEIPKTALPNREKPITLLPPIEISEVADILIEVGKFENRGDAFIWLMHEGIKAKNLELAQAKQISEQIMRLKQSIPV